MNWIDRQKKKMSRDRRIYREITRSRKDRRKMHMATISFTLIWIIPVVIITGLFDPDFIITGIAIAIFAVVGAGAVVKMYRRVERRAINRLEKKFTARQWRSDY